MDVAVIITLFNGAKWIRPTLESVFSQEHPPVEVVVVDDGSEDGSPEIVRSFPGVTLLRNSGKGENSACEFGFRHTNAPLVAFLDHDDIWHPSHLRILSSILEQNPQCPAAFSICLFFNSDDSLVFPSPKLNAVPFDPWRDFPKNKIPTNSSVVIRRDALNEMGGWPAKFSGCGDAYTWFRLSVAQPLIENRSTTIGYRQHESSLNIDLRSQKALSYFNEALAASEDAVAHRLAIYPENSDRLKRRLAVLTPMSDILKATINSDYQLLKESALAFEASLAGESTAFIKSMLNMLFWFLSPSLNIETLARKTDYFKILIQHWPKDARNSREALMDYNLGNRIIWNSWNYLSTQPWQISRWTLFRDVLYLRLLWYWNRFTISTRKSTL
ncbi:glycosyltransferase family 2 protein [Argonema antarcticum]|uniref:glycosyltransferase family 2 protein n=1 Tax=Argonema antarcticum TaxID=2942763 RepID=UPI002012288B|nr:glycosyltransferase family 2 protein [Argonema antarcticum]MCL1473554.1 glycosyltransferase [Argonema antarcticum A004/B2]